MEGFSNRLKGIPSAVVWNAATKAIEEVEKIYPGAIRDHEAEVCAIFTQVIKKHNRDAPAALEAKNLAFVNDLGKSAEAQVKSKEPGAR